MHASKTTRAYSTSNPSRSLLASSTCRNFPPWNKLFRTRLTISRTRSARGRLPSGGTSTNWIRSPTRTCFLGGLSNRYSTASATVWSCRILKSASILRANVSQSASTFASSPRAKPRAFSAYSKRANVPKNSQARSLGRFSFSNGEATLTLWHAVRWTLGYGISECLGRRSAVSKPIKGKYFLLHSGNITCRNESRSGHPSIGTNDQNSQRR